MTASGPHIDECDWMLGDAEQAMDLKMFERYASNFSLSGSEVSLPHGHPGVAATLREIDATRSGYIATGGGAESDTRSNMMNSAVRPRSIVCSAASLSHCNFRPVG